VRRLAAAVVGAALVLALPSLLEAQRISTVGVGVDVAGSVDDNPPVSGGARPDSRVSSVSVYPNVTFTSQSEHGALTLDYAYGWNRLNTSPGVVFHSHSASAAYSKALSPKWSTSWSSSFSLTNDERTNFALRGILPTQDPAILRLLFDPVAVRQNALTIGTNASFSHPLSTKSSLTFAGGYLHRGYQSSDSSDLSNQNGVNGSFGYSRRFSEHSTWDIYYDGSYYTFAKFNNAVTNVVRFGVNTQLTKDMTIGSNVGLSHAQNTGGGGGSSSYEASAHLSKALKDNLISLSISQNFGHPSGLGSVSRNRQANVGLSRNVGSHVNVFTDISVFDSKGVLENRTGFRGGSATANVGFLITRSLSLHIGAQMQRYTRPVEFAFTQKRVFASLRYSHPNLLHSR
jgi:hypothetical protein